MNETTQIRKTRRQQIEDFFLAHIGVRYPTMMLHVSFGTSLRTRVSEINRDPASRITIHNETSMRNGKEYSMYWAEFRKPHESAQQNLFAVQQ